MIFFAAYLLLVFFVCIRGHIIDEFGAIAEKESWEIAKINSQAFLKALSAANASSFDRTVLFPEGKHYFMYVVAASYLNDVTIQIDGILRYSDEIKRYPAETSALIHISESHGITLTGKGKIDGQGLNWWRRCYTGVDDRPDMVTFQYSTSILIYDLFLYSSPKYSLNFKDCAHVTIHDVTIYINSSVTRGLDDHPSVTYALNTDGMDLAVFNATIYNNVITNYDDGIVVKPCRSDWRYCTCAGNIYAYNNSLTYSTGLTIGSVPPNAHNNCVRNVTFADSTLYRPLKGIYIKSNPGTNGTGTIEHITYRNIYMDTALWWPIWIGPQQQNQPGSSAGTGCNFLFPFIPICPTNPLVTMRDIQLVNIHANNTLPLFLSPGVVLCNASNPCQEVGFSNVTVTVFTGSMDDIINELPIYYVPGIIFPTPYRPTNYTYNFITDNVYGAVDSLTSPLPCFNEPSCFFSNTQDNYIRII